MKCTWIFKYLQNNRFVTILCIWIYSSVNLVAQSWNMVGQTHATSYQVEFPRLATHNGVPYIAFIEHFNTIYTGVTKFDGTSWLIEAPLTNFNGYDNFEMYEDTMYIVIRDTLFGNRMTVKRYENGTWVDVGTRGFTQGAINHSILAFDANGLPYVAYLDESLNFQISVMRYDGNNWISVGGTGISTSNISLFDFDLDHNNIPYVAYKDPNNAYKLTVKRFDGANWVVLGNIGYLNGIAWNISLVINKDGIPYIAYENRSHELRIYVIKHNGIDWVHEGPVSVSDSAAGFPSLIIDDNNIPYVAYSDRANGYKAMVKKFNGTEWELVGSPVTSTPAFYFINLAMSNNILYLSYRDDYNGSKCTVMQYDLNVGILPIEDSKNTIKIYPNPVNSDLSIESNFPIQTISIFDISGKYIKSSNDLTISVEELPPAVYLIRCTGEEGSVYNRFIKN